MKESLLILNGQRYKLSQLLVIANTAPTIGINATDINDGSNSEHRVSFEPATPIANDHQPMLPIVFKQHGKFTVLLGETLIKDGMNKVRLLSTPALKKARLPDPNTLTIPPAPIQPSYSAEFANRPRVTLTSHERPNRYPARPFKREK